jgi:asparagine synthase (glutamine-hydrolysing)
MCGIVGACNLHGEPIAANLIQDMADAVRHRGPDGDGVWTNGPVGLGHRRLAIIDLTAAGHQPMSNETADVLIVYNGELYNHQQLRVELEATGHRFHSRTDTEVIVHAYEQWGESCLDRFNGIFAFAIWDDRRRRLWLARDRFGVKPLYYYFDGRTFVFGSEVKALLKHPAVSRKVCYRALHEYLTFQNILTDLTLFEGVKLLSAGHFLTLDLGTSQLSERRYWDACFDSDPWHGSDEEAACEISRLFAQAVTRQLMSDVPVGSYLSGGMDSGSITGVARRHLGRLTTFTAGFDLSSASGMELGFDERANAETLSNVLKTEHYETVLHAGDMEHVMPELIWHLEDLRVGQCYPNYYVARLAGKFVRVVLSGAGGDELFGGYPWRYKYALRSREPTEFVRNYYDFWQRLVPDDEKCSFLASDVARHVADYSTFEVFRRVLERSRCDFSTQEGRLNGALYFEAKTFLHGLLVVEDKISMAHSLETRVPFLDNDLADFAMVIPARLKLRTGGDDADIDEDAVNTAKHESRTRNGKIILRKAMRGLIPSQVIERPKQGFAAPDASWFRGESIEYVSGLLRNPKARIFDLLDYAAVVPKVDDHVEGRSNRRLLIWSLLSLEWWLRTFMK